MGGYFSGRHGWRPKCENLLSIDVRRWAREGYLASSLYFGWQWTKDGEKTASIGVRVHEQDIELEYVKDGESHRYRVYLASSPCHFGGQRLWFCCPAVYCGRKVAKLYLGNRYFACRRCYNLAYQSQSLAMYDRALVHSGLSGMELDTSSKNTTATLQLKILGFSQKAGNEPASANAKVLVKINNHQLGSHTGTAGV